MRNWKAIKERYMRDDLSVRLGGLAANLSRIGSFATQDANREVVESILDESKLFIEWTAPHVEIDAAAKLVDLQIHLARWQRNWTRIWDDPEQRRQVVEQSSIWSEHILELSGLLS